MVLYACGNNTSKQICNDAPQILCCPTQVDFNDDGGVVNVVNVQIAFSHILWKVGRNWKLTGFEARDSVMVNSIHPQWKLAVSENKKIAINESGSVMVYENGTAWKTICYQHLENFSDDLEPREHNQRVDTVDSGIDLLVSAREDRKNVKRKQVKDELTEDDGQSDSARKHIRYIKKDSIELQSCSESDLKHGKNSHYNENLSSTNGSCNATKPTSTTSADFNAPKDFFCKVCTEENAVLSLSKGGVIFSGNVSVPVLRHRITDIALGKEHYMALTDEGVVLTWGSGMRGQLGNGNICQGDHPSPVHSLQGLAVTSIACGGWHSAAVSDSGDVYLWGWNESGQLGFPAKTQGEKSVFGSFEFCCQCPVTLQDDASQSSDTKVKNIYKIATDSSSDDLVKPEKENISCTSIKQLEVDERINCNRSSEVMNVQASPVLLDFWCEGISIKEVACGDRHSLFLLDDGSVWSAGMNKYGQLGLGHINFQNEPAEISIKNVTQIYAGGWNSVFVTD